MSYGDDTGIGVPIEKTRIMVEAFLELDPWARVRRTLRQS